MGGATKCKPNSKNLMEIKMLKTLLTKTIFAIALSSVLGTAASANIVLDLDLNEGNQGLITRQVQIGDIVEIELIAQQGAQDIAGFEVVIKFDGQQFIFNGYQRGGLMASAISLPAAPTADGVKISAGFLGGKSAFDSGSLGTLVFEVTQDLSAGGSIMLTQGSFGAAGRTDQFALNSEVILQGPTNQQDSGFQNDPMNDPNQPDMNNLPENPIELIKWLPTDLQGVYIETHRTRLQGELNSLLSMRQTLATTNQYLAIANEQQKIIIGKVLMGLHHKMHNPDQGNLNQEQPPTNVHDLLQMMFQNIEQDIQHVTQRLQEIQ
ncbi:MAG: hypothetical protein ACI8V2_003842 [Candidatus Latescibacterota bacterium]|jgi:hypothetical protein